MTHLLTVSTMIFIDEKPVAALRSLYEAGVDFAELNYENIKRSEADYASIIAEYRWALLEATRLGISVPVVHAPYETYFLPSLGKGVKQLIREGLTLLDLFSSYGAEYIVFHPFGSEHVGAGRVWWLNKAFFSVLADYASSIGVKILVENTLDTKPWSSVTSLVKLVREIGSKSLKVCLDTGHAIINEQDPAKLVEEYHEDIGGLHISDNNGKSDDHLLPGTGVIDWVEFRKAVLKAENLACVMEVKCSCLKGENCRSRAYVARLIGGWITGEIKSLHLVL